MQFLIRPPPDRAERKSGQISESVCILTQRMQGKEICVEMRFIMKSKVKKRCKQMLTGLLALSMLCGLLPQNTVNVSAATTAKTTVSSYGRQAAYFMESELAFSIADRYIYIQDATEGYDYTIYDSDFTELDGGVYDDPENSIYETLDEIKDVQEAIALWKEFQDSPLNGIPSIGILVHTPGQTDLEDEQLDLLSGQKIDLDMMQYYPVICKEEAAIEKICELIENLPEVGKVPERISTELLLRELDPRKSLFSEEEKSLIREYGLQVKDERKTREFAEKLCSRDKIGNQDVVLAVAKVKEEMEGVLKHQKWKRNV